MALYKAWCRLTKRYEFTHASNEEEARENLIKKIKFKNKLYYVKDEDFGKVFEHKEPKPLGAYKLGYYLKGDSSIVFNVFVIAKSKSQAELYLRRSLLLPIFIEYNEGDSTSLFKTNHPEESLEEGKVIATW